MEKTILGAFSKKACRLPGVCEKVLCIACQGKATQNRGTRYASESGTHTRVEVGVDLACCGYHLVQHFWKALWTLFKSLRIKLRMIQQFHLGASTPRAPKLNLKDFWTPIFISALFMVDKSWKLLRYLKKIWLEKEIVIHICNICYSAIRKDETMQFSGI